VNLLREEKEGQKAHQGGAGIGTKSSPEAAMAAGLALGCARWGNEKERGAPGLACGQVKGEEGGSGQRGTLTSGGPSRQRRGCDVGGRQSGGALVWEQGMGRRQQVGRYRWWGPAV
jgi:hypothetical protein